MEKQATSAACGGQTVAGRAPANVNNFRAILISAAGVGWLTQTDRPDATFP